MIYFFLFPSFMYLHKPLSTTCHAVEMATCTISPVYYLEVLKIYSSLTPRYFCAISDYRMFVQTMHVCRHTLSSIRHGCFTNLYIILLFIAAI